MCDDIKKFVQEKCRCVANKQPNVKLKAPLHPIAAQTPFEMISIDLIELDPCKGGFKYGLVVVDHFTRFCQFYATRTKSTKAIAQKIFNEFILQWGFPTRIHHDMGREFNSSLFTELHRLTGIKASNTTPYYPQGDGQCERLNRTLVNMLKTLSQKEKSDWKSHLPKLAYAVNSTRNKTTGFSPHYLMFGREAMFPIDQVFSGVGGESTEIVKSHQDFVADWEKSMKGAYDIARTNINKSAAYNKQHYDKRAKAAALQLGDQVLVRNYREKTGKPKMRSYYEENIFKVVEVRAEVPVYKIQNLKKAKDVRVVHRNKLLKVDELPLDVFDDIKDTPAPKQNTKKNARKKKEKEVVQNEREIGIEEKEKVSEEHLDVESESDEEYAVVVEERRNVRADLSSSSDSSDSEPEESLNNAIPENEDEDSEDVTQQDENELETTVAYDDESALESLESTDRVADTGSESLPDIAEETTEEAEKVVSTEDIVSSEEGESDSQETQSGDTDGDEEESEGEDSPQVVRRSSCTVIPRKVFTYAELGANPVCEPYT